LSLTLRDGQHLTWKTFKKFEKIDQKQAASFSSASQLMNRAGKIAEKMKKLEDSSSAGDKEEFAKMLSELLFSLFVLAERFGVNLEESFLQAVDDLILGFVS
jgi:hypothetical protein